MVGSGEGKLEPSRGWRGKGAGEAKGGSVRSESWMEGVGRSFTLVLRKGKKEILPARSLPKIGQSVPGRTSRSLPSFSLACSLSLRLPLFCLVVPTSIFASEEDLNSVVRRRSKSLLVDSDFQGFRVLFRKVSPLFGFSSGHLAPLERNPGW